MHGGLVSLIARRAISYHAPYSRLSYPEARAEEAGSLASRQDHPQILSPDWTHAVLRDRARRWPAHSRHAVRGEE
jgi:hypothetical protein